MYEAGAKLVTLQLPYQRLSSLVGFDILEL